MNAFDDKSETLDKAKAQSFDSVLRVLKKEAFNEVYDIALDVSEDDHQSLLDRIKAGLVAARFAYFHILIEEAHKLIQRIPPLLGKFGKIRDFCYFVLNLSDPWNFCLNSFKLNLKLYENSDKECDNDNLAKSLRVAYTTLMVEILPTSSDISLREMAERSLEIDRNNANPFIVLIYRAKDVRANPAMTLAARIPEIDSTSPYAEYLFSIVIFLLHTKSIASKDNKKQHEHPFIFLSKISIETTSNTRSIIFYCYYITQFNFI